MLISKKIALCAGVMAAYGLFGTPNALAALPIQHWTQPSGAQVFLVESPSIPMVDVQIDFDAGGRRDPAAQAGLASMTAGQASQGVRAVGGLPALDENALGEAWADLGASFGASAGGDIRVGGEGPRSLAGIALEEGSGFGDRVQVDHLLGCRAAPAVRVLT